jgi:hypothetical protein
MKTALVVIPTQETFKRLHQMMSSAPFNLDFDAMMLTVAIAERAADASWAANPNNVYEDVQVLSVQATQEIEDNGMVRVELSAQVASPKLLERSEEFGDGWTTMKWTLVRDLPPGRSTRVFVASLTDTLIYKESPFSFSHEMTVQG